MTMRIGVIGLAGVGKAHVLKFSALEGATLACVCDINKEVLAEAAAKHGVPGYADAGEMLAKEKLDGVSLCTPPASHLPLTRLAAERGVHVLCEKPMATTLEQCQGMIEVC
ncbi:MAG: Gfo/Idh/MocA family oxidoreductase, partial [Planctomycetes bacterium]|nr:Gfo/Idh/MocA family oxidoreductase [Planctomycetota bacterium]